MKESTGRRAGALAVCLALAGCVPGSGIPDVTARAVTSDVTLGGVAFSSLHWQVKLDALPQGIGAAALHDELQGSLDALEAVLSTWREDSEVSRFNRLPVGQCLAVAPVLVEAVARAAEVSALSGGGYDITVGPLVDLWGFGPATGTDGLPAAGALAAAKARVDWRLVQVDRDGRLCRRGDVRVDLSSVGEGAAVEALARVLRARGARAFLARVAGTVRTQGARADGSGWQLAVEAPDGSGRPARRLHPGDAVVSTSGAYRRYREVGGRRFSHTLDARTGLPVTHAGMSVTVVLPPGESALRADALATALNVLGPDDGLALATRQGWAVFYFEADGAGFRTRASPAFAAQDAGPP